MKTMFGGLDAVCPNTFSMPDASTIVPMVALRNSVRRVISWPHGIDVLLISDLDIQDQSHPITATAPSNRISLSPRTNTDGVMVWPVVAPAKIVESSAPRNSTSKRSSSLHGSPHVYERESGV